MARDIQIPFGPDRTNGVGIEPIPSDDAAPRDAFAEPQAGEYARAGLAMGDRSQTADAFAQNSAYAASADASAASASASVIPAMAPQIYGQGDESDSGSGGISQEEAAAQGMDDVQMSFAALRDSIGQGRELKVREKEYDELSEALEADHEELADRDYILANFDKVIGEQDTVIAEHTQRRDARKAELAQLVGQLDNTRDELERMRDYHAMQLQPLETELGQARAGADQAKNDERSRKAELSAAESELRRTSENEANYMAVAQHKQVQAAYDEAHRRSDQAKERLAQVQRAYDDARNQVEQAEGPLERSIEDLTRHSEELKEEINHLGEEISSARKRRQYCETVHQYPEETERMRAEVAAAEEVARQMDAENEVLREQLAVSKRKSRKAKVAIGIVIAIVVIFLVALFIVTNR